MLYTKKFVITVSLCAILAANPVLAVTNPVEAKAAAKSGKPGEVSTVYSDWAGRAESGIAGVSYVNSAVDVAGNAAQWAENHAAAAAQSAKSAADSAAQAASKVSIDQGADNKYKAMVTNEKGLVYPGYIDTDMIADGGLIDVTDSPYSGFVLWSDHDGNVSWKTADSEVLADGAVGADKLSAGIPDSSTGFLAYSGSVDDVGKMVWRMVKRNIKYYWKRKFFGKLLSHNGTLFL